MDDTELVALGCAATVGASMAVAALAVALGAAFGWRVGVVAWLAFHAALLLTLAARGVR